MKSIPEFLNLQESDIVRKSGISIRQTASSEIQIPAGEISPETYESGDR